MSARRCRLRTPNAGSSPDPPHDELVLALLVGVALGLALPGEATAAVGALAGATAASNSLAAAAAAGTSTTASSPRSSVLTALLLFCVVFGEADYVLYKDATQPMEAHVSNLLARMMLTAPGPAPALHLPKLSL